jgi:hypothetical protein
MTLDFLRARVAAASASWASAEARRVVFVRLRGGGVKIVSTAFLVRAEADVAVGIDRRPGTDHCQQAKNHAQPGNVRTSPPTLPAPAASSSDFSFASFSSASAASMVYPGLRIVALGVVAGVRSHR